MRIEANRMEGYRLLQRGIIALAEVEANGIRIDMERMERTKLDLAKRIRKLKHKLEKSDVWRTWRRRFGSKSNLTSRDQLAVVLHEELGHAVGARTATGKPSTDEEALQKIDDPFVVDLLRMTKYEKALGTFLKGIEKEVMNDRLHPVFNLHTARTYRSSSDSPNFQNFPVRDKEIARIIRSHFIPSPGCVLVENDFKGIEVSVSACYHKDTNFISYITTPGKDMHRDMAAQLYMLDPADVSKEARYGAKNKFVFPQFYGDYYISCTKSLWEWIDKGKLVTPDGTPLKEHLRSQGIKKCGRCDPEEEARPGTFERHVRDVENDFWNHRFMQYGKWRKDWYRSYLERGYFDILTGFRVFGSFARNSVVNYPVQGAAFHCLLWSLIQVNRLLHKHKFKSKIVGQIHDSLISDVRVDELRDFLEIVEEVTTVQLRKHYEWLVVPLEIEYEIAPSNGTWYDKQEVRFKKGRFFHPKHPDKFTTDPHKFIKLLNQKLNNE